MNHDIAMLTRVFKDADTLVNRIDQNHSLKNYFMCGACGQLAKLIYQHFINKRKKIISFFVLWSLNFMVI